MKTQINIYKHNNYLTFMKMVVDDFKKRKSGPQSLGEWANRLGYKSPRTLGMILDGKRLPSGDLINAFTHYLEFKSKDKEYFRELIQIQKLKDRNRPVEQHLNNLKRLNPNQTNFVEINPTSFSYISKWYHLVIKELLRGKKKYKENYFDIKHILRNKISISEIKQAINNLIKLGYLRRENDHTLSSQNIDLMTDNQITTEAKIIHHQGMLELAKQAIQEQDKDEREFQAFTFKMNPNDLPEAKEYIRNIIKEFNNKFCDENEENVYQLNINLFSHTNNKGLPQ